MTDVKLMVTLLRIMATILLLRMSGADKFKKLLEKDVQTFARLWAAA